MVYSQKMENKNLTLENGGNAVPMTIKDHELERELYEMMTENIPIWPSRYDLWFEEDSIDNDISKMERALYEKLERELYGEVFCEDGKNFKSALDYFWNKYGSAKEDLLLIVCGSSTSWIISNLW